MKHILSLVIFSIVITLGLTGCIGGFGKTEIDVSQAYKISYQGTNQEGEIEVWVNRDKLFKQLKLSPKAKQDFELINELQELFDSISIEAEPNHNLENGQEVELICSWDNELANKLKIKPVLKESKHIIPEDTFQDLKELTEEEVFEGVSMFSDGVYPIITAQAKYAFPNYITKHIQLSIDKVDWTTRKAIVRAEMDESVAASLGFSFKPMTREFDVPGYSTFHIDWKSVSPEQKQAMAEAGKNVLQVALERFKGDGIGGPFEGTIYKTEKEKRAFKDIKLNNITYAQIREGAEPGVYTTSILGMDKSMYSRLLLTYSFTMIDHVHTEGITRYVWVMANNVRLLENGDVSYDLGEVEVQSDYVTDNQFDGKSSYVDKFADSHEIVNYPADQFLK